MAPRRPRKRVSVPIVEWLPSYDTKWLSKDAIAAASVWALLVPQGVAYASIAGVPPQYGLYAAMFALVLYAVLGSSRQVVTGPSATVAAVSASVVGTIGAAGAAQSDTWIAYTATLAVLAGLVYAAMGILRMGWLSNFLSTSVLEGFVFGFGIGLTIDQTHKILGTPKVEGIYLRVLVGTVQDIPQTSMATLAVGGTAIALLLLMRRLLPRWPRALIVVVLGVVVSSLAELSSHGVAIVGEVPTGLPGLATPVLTADTIGTLIAGAFAVIMVGFSESIAAARASATKHGYDIDASQEMLAQGGANAASGIVGGFVVAGSLSKTTVADLAGQRSQLASLINAGLILMTILFLAGVFTNLPEAVLGAVVIDAAIGLISVKSLRRVAVAGRRDFAAFVAAGVGLLVVGVLVGVLIGAILSLILLVAAASSSPVRRLGLHPDEHVYVDVDEYPTADISGEILVVDVAGPLFFADAHGFREEVLAMVASESPAAVVVDLAPVTLLDLDGADILVHLHADLTVRGVRLALARVGRDELEVLQRTGVVDIIGAENLFVSSSAAVAELTTRA